jgi:hypothetical protein
MFPELKAAIADIATFMDVLGNPYRSEIVDEIGNFKFDFLAAARPLLRQRIGVWTSSELSWWYPGPGGTVCVLAPRSPANGVDHRLRVGETKRRC